MIYIGWFANHKKANNKLFKTETNNKTGPQGLPNKISKAHVDTWLWTGQNEACTKIIVKIILI